MFRLSTMAVKGFVAIAALCAAVAPVKAVVIDFDGFANGTPITTQYQSVGAVFASNGGSAAHILSDVAEATSLPNILVGANSFSDLFLTFVDPATGLASTVSNVSLYAVSVGAAQYTITARDSGGQVLQSFVLQHADGPANGLGNQDLVSFAPSGIASIDFVFTISNPVDGIGIDDLTFTREAMAVPEPSASVLMGLGISLLGLCMRRRSIAANAG